MKKLWQKQWELDPSIEAFETGDDLLLDQKLVWADIAGSLAHAMMLKNIGILTEDELGVLKKGLYEIQRLNKQGKFALAMGDEDIHTKIEQYLTKHYGVVGKKIHTGRSRNDQVLTVLRLYEKHELLSVWQQALALADAFCSFAIQYEYVSMPGYTHMQKAMPSSVGMWGASFASSLLDDIAQIKSVYHLIDQSPLGSAAGYGVPLALDKKFTARLLGFARVQEPSLYCQNSRGKLEAAIVSVLVSLLLTINKFASDILLFTTCEFDLFAVADELTTGSSIMPQKRNIDIAELLRSKVHVVAGHCQALVGISSNLPSGYNRDLQDTKKPVMESFAIAKASIIMAGVLLAHVTPKKDHLANAMTPELFATHQVLALAAQGMPFREAYHAYAKGKKVTVVDWKAPGIEFSTYKQKLDDEHAHCHNANKQFTTALSRLGVPSFVPCNGTSTSAKASADASAGKDPSNLHMKR